MGLSVHNVSILHGVFTRVDAGVPMFLWENVDDLEELWYYAWGPAVHHFTTRNFKDVAQGTGSISQEWLRLCFSGNVLSQ
jgi:hypothetical protein